jgi:hypothetical protein
VAEEVDDQVLSDDRARSDDRLHAELDRQLAEVRAASDGVATRSGLLVAAISAAALLLGPRINPAHHKVLLVVTAIVLGIATVAAVATLLPWLQTGPDRLELLNWLNKRSFTKTSKKLFMSKAATLGGNLSRLALMRWCFALQGIASVVGIALALWYVASK